MKTILNVLLALNLVLIILLPAAGAAQARPFVAGPPPGAIFEPAAVEAPGIRLLTAGENGVQLELQTAEYAFAPAGDGVRLEVPGLQTSAHPGEPALPVAYALLAVPPTGEVTITLLEADSERLPETPALVSAPAPAPLEEALQPGGWAAPEVYSPAAPAGQSAAAALIPAQPARIVEVAWLRSQRLARVAFSPFQLDPSSGELIWHRRLLAQVNFSAGAAAAASVDPQPAFSLERLALGQVLNAAQAPGFLAASGPETAAAAALDAALAPAASSAADAYVPSASLGPRLRLGVTADGIYRLTYADLQAAGLDPAGLDPRNFRLSNQGRDAALYIAGEVDGKFDTGDVLYFYGEAFRGEEMAARYAAEDDHWPRLSGWQPHLAPVTFEQYTDENVYWLQLDGPPGPRMPTVSGLPSGGAPIPAYYTATQRVEESHEWWSFHFTGEDAWFWNTLRPSGTAPAVTKNYPVTLSAVATAPGWATVHGEVVARTSNITASPDHRTQARFNGYFLEEAFWDGSTRHVFDAQVPLANLLEGTNTLAFTALDTAALNADWIYFDFYEIDYPRQFAAVADALAFQHTAAGAREYRVTGLESAPVAVLEISDPLQPRWVLDVTAASQGGGIMAAWETSDPASTAYAVAGTNGLRSPDSLSLYAPPDLFSSTNGADYLIITHADFVATAQTLADYRAAQGLRTRVIDVADLYAEFNDGIYHPLAIKTFLRYAYANWASPAPLYVVLVGAGHFNFKNFVGETNNYDGGPIYMPPYQVWVDYWQGEVDSSSLLANIVGTDILPDLHIGRIPVASAAELEAVIQKTIAYESAGWDPWQANLLFVADNIPDPDNAGDFVALSESAIAHTPPDYKMERVYLNDFGCATTPGTVGCLQTTQALTRTLNITGALFTNYIGHGKIPGWTKEGVFQTSRLPGEIDDSSLNHLRTLHNSDRPTVVLSLTCLDGFWSHPSPGYPSLAAGMVNLPTGGAVGAFSPTGLGVATGHDVLNRAFYDAVFTDGAWQLGPAALAAKLALFNAGYAYDLIDTFTIFGDPALHFKSPYAPEAAALDADKGGAPNYSVAYPIEVANRGARSDSFTVAVESAGWPVSAPAQVGPLAPGETMLITATVSIPAGALDNESDSAILRVTSSGDAFKSVTVQLTTLAQDYGVDLSAANPDQSAPSGSQISYNITLRNAGAFADSYTLAVNGGSWAHALASQNVGPLAPGEAVNVQFTVTVPPASGGQTQQFTLLATSQAQPTKTDSVTVTATAQMMALYMPVSVK